MKTAIYIEDGITQVVLSAETKSEEAALALIREAGNNLTVKNGSFFMCQAGYVRFNSDLSSYSTMLVVRRGGEEKG